MSKKNEEKLGKRKTKVKNWIKLNWTIKDKNNLAKKKKKKNCER